MIQSMELLGNVLRICFASPKYNTLVFIIFHLSSFQFFPKTVTVKRFAPSPQRLSTVPTTWNTMNSPKFLIPQKQLQRFFKTKLDSASTTESATLYIPLMGGIFSLLSQNTRISSFRRNSSQLLFSVFFSVWNIYVGIFIAFFMIQLRFSTPLLFAFHFVPNKNWTFTNFTCKLDSSCLENFRHFLR